MPRRSYRHSLLPVSRQTVPLQSVVVGPTIGAYAGYQFNQLTTKHEQKRERWKKHYNGLVELEGELDVLRSTLDDNIFSLQGLVNHTRGRAISSINLKLLRANESFRMTLWNVEVVNDLHHFYHGVRKINVDIENLRDRHTRLTEIVFSINGFGVRVEEMTKYFEQMDNVIDQMVNRLIIFSKSLLEESIRMSAVVRYLYRRDKDSGGIPIPLRAIDQNQVAECEQEIRQELEDSRRQSQIQLEQLFPDMTFNARSEPRHDS